MLQTSTFLKSHQYHLLIVMNSDSEDTGTEDASKHIKKMFSSLNKNLMNLKNDSELNEMTKEELLDYFCEKLMKSNNDHMKSLEEKISKRLKTSLNKITKKIDQLHKTVVTSIPKKRKSRMLDSDSDGEEKVSFKKTKKRRKNVEVIDLVSKEDSLSEISLDLHLNAEKNGKKKDSKDCSKGTIVRLKFETESHTPTGKKMISNPYIKKKCVTPNHMEKDDV